MYLKYFYLAFPMLEQMVKLVYSLDLKIYKTIKTIIKADKNKQAPIGVRFIHF